MAPKRRRRSSSSNNTRSDRNPDPDRLIAELFREASALAATTGARVAVLARKPNGEVRQYGCPNVSAVLDRCVPPLPPPPAEASEEEEMVDRYVAAPANNGALLDRILRRYLERKRAEDPNYGEAAARDKEWKDLQWQLEILYRLRERVIAGHGN